MLRIKRREHDAVAERLRKEVDGARIVPSPGLHRRTLEAIRQASLDPPPARRTVLPVLGSYLAACAMLSGAIIFVFFTRPLSFLTPSPPADMVARPPTLSVMTYDTSGLDALVLKQLYELESNWEAQLLAEAKLIVDDARAAGQVVLARLPIPPALMPRDGAGVDDAAVRDRGDL